MVVLEASSADEWQDVVSSCFVPLLCEAPGGDRYSARMQHVSFGSSLSISLLATDGTRVHRSARLAARAESDDLHMSFQLASTGRVTQGGRSVPVRPGSLTVYATDAPYEQDYSRHGQRQLIVQISRKSMRLPGRMVDEACQRMSVPTLTAARVFHTFVARLVEARTDDPATVGATAADLASSMLQSSFSTGPVMPRTGPGLLETVRDHVRHNFTAPDLTVDSLAAQHFISRRRLYQLFDDVGESPSECIRSHRLEYAAGLLGDVGSPGGQVVGDVAQLSGFSDAATFARAFRRKYGMNPSEFRAHRVSAA